MKSHAQPTLTKNRAAGRLEPLRATPTPAAPQPVREVLGESSIALRLHPPSSVMERMNRMSEAGRGHNATTARSPSRASEAAPSPTPLGTPPGKGKRLLPPLAIRSRSSACQLPMTIPPLSQAPRAATPGTSSAVGSEMEDERAIRPYLRPEHQKYTGVPPVDDDLWQPAKALRSLVAFDLTVEQKVEFEDFVRQGRSKAAPSLIINYFKHYMCASSTLVRALQALPLSDIERVVKAIPKSTMMSPKHLTVMFLDPLLGKHQFLEQDALALFDFLDTDSDGEIDFRDLCNGCVLLRSKDGPILPVVHKCMLLVAPKARREARLAMMTRLELLHLTNVLVGVLHDFATHARTQTELLAAAIESEVPPVYAKGVEMQQLRAQQQDVQTLAALERKVERDVRAMLETFSLDRRGNFPYANVREFMMQSTPIQQAISLMRVPRDEDLYNSFLSEFLRQAECDDTSGGNREFRPLLRNKAVLLCGLQGTTAPAQGAKATGLAARRQTFSKTNNAAVEEEEVNCVDFQREATEHDDPEFFTMRGMLYRRGRAAAPQDPSCEASGKVGIKSSAVQQAAAFVTKAEYFIEDTHGKRHHRF